MWTKLRSVVLLAACQLLVASAASSLPVWDLAADWSDATNPNGAWSLLQGPSLLPSQSDVGSTCCGPGSGIAAGFAPSDQPGNFLPLWAKAIGDNSAAGFLAGDVLVHSVDGFNGNPSLGETSVLWTSPVNGVIDVEGGVWYAHMPLDRSSDFVLTLNGVSIASGTVGAASGYDRSNPLGISALGLAVASGDILQLTFQRSTGFSAGSFSGVNLTVSQVLPEPSAAALLLGASLLSALRSKRRA